jgi:cyanophycin synthetase
VGLCLGDRRDEDLMELVTLAAKFFDRVIVKEDEDLRGRPGGVEFRLVKL